MDDPSSRTTELVDAWRSLSAQSRPLLDAAEIVRPQPRPVRRRLRRAGAGLGLVAAVVAVLVVGTSLRWGAALSPAASTTATPSGSGAPATATATPSAPPTSSPTPFPTPTPTAAPPIDPGDVYQAGFLDASFGWAYYWSKPARAMRLVVTDDGGRSWRNASPPDMSVLDEFASFTFLDRDHFFVNALHVAMDRPPAAWRTADGGRSWTAIAPPSDRVSWVSPTVGFAIGSTPRPDQQPVFRTDDGGTTWRNTVTGETPDTHAKSVNWSYGAPVFVNERVGVMAVLVAKTGADSTYSLVETADGGVSWTPVRYTDAPSSGLGVEPHIEARNGVIFAGLHFRTAESATWTRFGGATPSPCCVVYHLDGSEAVAVDFIIGGEYPGAPPAYLHTTTDGGRTWQSRRVPLFEELRPKVGLGGTADGSYGWATMLDGWAILTERCGAAGPCLDSELAFGALYVTHDGGVTWSASIPQH